MGAVTSVSWCGRRRMVESVLGMSYYIVSHPPAHYSVVFSQRIPTLFAGTHAMASGENSPHKDSATTALYTVDCCAQSREGVDCGTGCSG